MTDLRYNYSPNINRQKIRWPKGERVAFWIGLNIEYFYIDKPTLSATSSHLPDVQAYSLRDYGLRVGIFRIADVLDKYGLKASVLLNSDICKHCPIILEEGKRRHWEWLGHGINNHFRNCDYPPEEERKIIHEVKETITKAVGTAPKGWLGPAGAESFDTPEHLATEGFEYLCDWGCDDQPIPMRVQSGRMIAMPYQQGINDIAQFVTSNHTAEQYLQHVCDQFDILYREGSDGGRVMTMPLHTFIIGLPFRIKYLDRALEYICSHEGVWCATSGEIAAWYYQNYYQDPG